MGQARIGEEAAVSFELIDLGSVPGQIQASIRAVNAAEREAIRRRAVHALSQPRADHPYLNFAVPNAGAVAWEGIDRLRAAFDAQGLRPRLEFVPSARRGSRRRSRPTASSPSAATRS